MNKKILFSPVGGTDPISLNNCRDGSLLHICRVYKPDIVYMYMSAEIITNHEHDNRYIYCLDKLCNLLGHNMEYRIIEKRNLKNVQDYDYYYTDFRNTIKGVIDDMDESDTLILNVSSGTPAMKSGLIVLATLGEFNCKIVQVVTPERAMGEHSHMGYDVETLWELDEDNVEDFENRCIEVHCPTLSIIKSEELIKSQILSYDYSAAYSIAKTLPQEYTNDYIDFIKFAEARMQLDFSTADPLDRGNEASFFPVRSSNEKKYFEYALSLDIKLKRKEYVDFVRGITPIIVDLLELILKHTFRLDINTYCMTDKNKMRRWDRCKLDGTPVLEAIKKEFPNFDYKMISSVHLVAIIKNMFDDADVSGLAAEMRSVEENVRNIAAHDIVSITEEVIVKRTGFTPQMIMDKIHRAFAYSGIKVKKEYWNSYNDMNAEILKRIV